MYYPKISIVTPSYNQAKYLEETICSVLNQNYPNLEYIIIDGGSTDGSLEIIQKYEKHLTYWVSEPDSGQSNAINKGFKHAKGELFGWINSDDYYLPDAFSAVAGAYKNSVKPSAIVGIGRWVDQNGKDLGEHTPKKVDPESIVACGENWIPQPACFFPAEAFRTVGGIDEKLHYAMDFDLFVKLSKNIPFVKLDKCISVALSHPKAKTKASRGKMFAEVRLIQIKNGGEKYALDALYYDYTKLLWYESLTRHLKNSFIYRLFRKSAKKSIFGSP